MIARSSPVVEFCKIGEKIQALLGHFQKDFDMEISAETLGPKFGQYGTFLPTTPFFHHGLSQDKGGGTPGAYCPVNLNRKLEIPQNCNDHVPHVQAPTIDQRLEAVLGHFHKDFKGEITAENLGARYGEYGTFLPVIPQVSIGLLPDKNSSLVGDSSVPKSEVGLKHPIGGSQNGSVCFGFMQAPTIQQSNFKYLQDEVSKPDLPFSIAKRTQASTPKCESLKTKPLKNLERETLKVHHKLSGGENESKVNPDSNCFLVHDNQSLFSFDDGGIERSNQNHDSPSSIIQDILSFEIPGGALVSPLPESLLCLEERGKPSIRGFSQSTGEDDTQYAPKILKCSSHVGGWNKKAGSKLLDRNGPSVSKPPLPSHGSKQFLAETAVSSKNKKTGSKMLDRNGLNVSKPPLPSHGSKQFLAEAAVSIKNKKAGSKMLNRNGPNVSKPPLPSHGSKQFLAETAVSSMNKKAGSKMLDRNGPNVSKPPLPSHGSKKFLAETAVSSNNKKAGSKMLDRDGPNVSKPPLPSHGSKQFLAETAVSSKSSILLSMGERNKYAAKKCNLMSDNTNILVVSKASAEATLGKRKQMNQTESSTKRSKVVGEVTGGHFCHSHSFKQKDENNSKATYIYAYQTKISKSDCSQKRPYEVLSGRERKAVDATVGCKTHNFLFDLWACCDDCEKWRLLPPGTNLDMLPEIWICHMQNWLPERLKSCSISEEDGVNTFYTLILGYQSLPQEDGASHISGRVNPAHSQRKFCTVATCEA